MSDTQGLKDPKKTLNTPSLVCDVLCFNAMDDGTAVTGVVAQFTYADGSRSEQSQKNLYLRNGDQTHLYSENRCVKSTHVFMACARPDGTVEVPDGQDPDAPKDKCWLRTAWGIRPKQQIAASEAGTQLPIEVYSKP